MIETRKRIVNKSVNIPLFTVIAMVALTALTGLVNQTLLSIGILLGCLVLFLYQKSYIGFPFMLFYSIFYGVVFGVAVSRIYTMLLILEYVIKSTKNTTIKAKYFPPLFIYIVYLIAVMTPIGPMMAVNVLIDTIACFILVFQLSTDEKDLKNFFRAYTVVCLCSFLSGTLANNTMGDEFHATRFLATFEDPNYMGFFFTVAIFATVTLKLFDKRIRYLIVIVLYIMLLTSLSITAIVVNVAMWAFYLIIMRKLKWWSIFIVVIVVVILLSLYYYGIDHPNTPILGDFAGRIEEKLDQAENGNINDVTTNRTKLAQNHLEYYMSSSVGTVLFGGVPVTPRYIHPDLRVCGHNEYIDMLLNVGLIGTLIMLGYFIYNTVQYAIKYKKSKKDAPLCIIVIKTLWACYALSLTVFLDFRFMLFFLL